MMKCLLKLFLPSSETLAELAAESIATAVNNANCKDQVAKYATIADKATDVQKWLTQMLADGKIDQLEQADISAKLVPLFEKVKEAL